jgi:hypothetical protein
MCTYVHMLDCVCSVTTVCVHLCTSSSACAQSPLYVYICAHAPVCVCVCVCVLIHPCPHLLHRKQSCAHSPASPLATYPQLFYALQPAIHSPSSLATYPLACYLPSIVLCPAPYSPASSSATYPQSFNALQPATHSSASPLATYPQLFYALQPAIPSPASSLATYSQLFYALHHTHSPPRLLPTLNRIVPCSTFIACYLPSTVLCPAPQV